MMTIKRITKNIKDYWSIIPLNLAQINTNQMNNLFTSTDTETTHELDITTSDLDIKQELREKDIKLNLLQKIRLHIFGKVHVGEYKKKAWQSAMPFYAFNCKEHGMQISYPTGWKKILKCQICYESI